MILQVLTTRRCRCLKSFLMKDKESFILHTDVMATDILVTQGASFTQ